MLWRPLALSWRLGWLPVKSSSCSGSQWFSAPSGDHPQESWAVAVSETLQAPSSPHAFGSDMPGLGFLPGVPFAAPELDSVHNLFTWSLERGGIYLFSVPTSGTRCGKLGKVASVGEEMPVPHRRAENTSSSVFDHFIRARHCVNSYQ